MLAIIILVLVTLLVGNTFLSKKKAVSKKKKIVTIIISCVLVALVIYPLLYDGIKNTYCLSNDKCVTVWKRGNGDVYVIAGKHKGYKEPSDNYVKLTDAYSSTYWFVHVIFTENDKLIVFAINDKKNIEVKSSANIVELYEDQVELNDSLYTYFDGEYRRYKKGVNFISINIKENYATDKTGEKIE